MATCNNCLHIVVCGKYQATGGYVRNCKHFATDNNVGDKQMWIPSSEQKPTREDGDKYGRVLVIEHGFISCAFWQAPINFPANFPYWMPMPKPPKE